MMSAAPAVIRPVEPTACAMAPLLSPVSEKPTRIRLNSNTY